MLLLFILVLFTMLISGYDIMKLRKMHFYNAERDGSVMKQNHCTVDDYDFFDKKNE